MKGVHEKEFSWKQFEKYFRKQYLSEKYMDGKTKELYELRMGNLTIDEFVNKFLELLMYVPYIKDEKVKMQWFVSGLPPTYWDRIEFNEPKTLEEAIRKARHFYEHFESKTRPHKDWKKKGSSGFQKKGFKSSIFKNYGKDSRGSLPARSVYQKNFPS